MASVVEILISVEAEAAAALTDARKREAIGRIVSRILRPGPDNDALLDAMERVSADAKDKGLTRNILEDELAGHRVKRTR